MIQAERTSIIRIILATILIIAIPILLGLIGIKSRIPPTLKKTFYISEPKDAFRVWYDSGLKGMILFCLDKRFRMTPLSQEAIEEAYLTGYSRELSNDNFLFLAINLGMIRKIYHVVPYNRWNEVYDVLSKMPRVLKREGLFRLTEDGVPIIVITEGQLPELKEPLLVYINEEVRDDYSTGLVDRITKGNSALILRRGH